ncbi:MAG: 1-acyl-sn-glycerol-3-phosphate acyltransferase [Pseudomonadota bacterium]
MTTWTKEKVPDLPKPSGLGRLVGGIRLVCLVLLTAIGICIFLIGRTLRKLLGRWIVFHFGVARFWANACLWLAGLRLRIHGKPIQRGALVANHSSWLDILALRATVLMYFVSKAEVANWPGIGFISRATGTVFIERKRTEAKRQEQILRERIAQDQLLCLFPEGTSTDGLRVLPFKSSLFSTFFVEGEGTDIEVQPVSVRYHAPGREGFPEDFYGWWGTMGFEKHIWEVLALSHGGRVDVTFHPAVRAAHFADRKALADVCQRAVAVGFDRLSGGAGANDVERLDQDRETA